MQIIGESFAVDEKANITNTNDRTFTLLPDDDNGMTMEDYQIYKLKVN